jgi:L-alanine-DL-glutamate epimerase-like enolase superfamily enzyme
VTAGDPGPTAARASATERATPATETDRIARLDTRLHVLPLSRPWGPDAPVVHVVAVDVTTDDGRVGHGFTWTPTIGAQAVKALLDHDIADAVVGGPVAPEDVWEPLWRHLHEAGGGGITTIAMAGLDLALWDLRARTAVGGIVDVMGRRRDRVRVYGSGVNLHYPTDELREQAQRWIAAGFEAVKIKVGSPDLERDVERVALVREVIGPERRLRVDANQRWDLATARRALAALAPFHLDWIEEPLLADDLPGHVELRRTTDVPVAIGENVHTEHRFREWLVAGACDIVQPNIVRVGGITPFLRIAEVVRDHGATLAPHLLLDLSGQLAVSLPDEVEVEDVEDASFAALGALDGRPPVAVADGWLTVGDHVGLGLRFVSD